MTNYTTLGGRIECTQCNALSKRTRQRCQAESNHRHEDFQ